MELLDQELEARFRRSFFCFGRVGLVKEVEREEETNPIVLRLIDALAKSKHTRII